MLVVIAPDSFKESLSAMEVATAIETGFKHIMPDALYVKLPMADGGEGTVQSMIDATSGRLVDVTVTGPLGTPVEGFFGLLGDGETWSLKWRQHQAFNLFQQHRVIHYSPPASAPVSSSKPHWI